MSLSADVYIDRLRLKNKLTTWRAITIVLVMALAFLAAGELWSRPMVGQPYIARIEVKDIILDDSYRDDILADLATDKQVKAVIVRIDSPGGTMLGGQELYLRLREISRHKPVVAVMRTLAASAAYLTALGADHIVAREGTLTGSIGVLIEAAEFTKLAEKVGVTPIIIKSSPLKATPSPMEPLTPESRAAAESVIMDSYRYFTDVVAKRRKLTPEELQVVADGRIFTGTQALKLKLIDTLGSEEEGLDWLEKQRKVSADLPVYDVSTKEPKNPWKEGIGGVVRDMLPTQLHLDGLVSIWHSNLL